jgi:hypothetical protein
MVWHNIGTTCREVEMEREEQKREGHVGTDEGEERKGRHGDELWTMDVDLDGYVVNGLVLSDMPDLCLGLS